EKPTRRQVQAGKETRHRKDGAATARIGRADRQEMVPGQARENLHRLPLESRWRCRFAAPTPPPTPWRARDKRDAQSRKNPCGKKPPDVLRANKDHRTGGCDSQRYQNDRTAPDLIG